MTQDYLYRKKSTFCALETPPADFQAVIEMLQSHQFPASRAVTRIVPLEEAGEALREWSANRARFAKILVRVGD